MKKELYIKREEESQKSQELYCIVESLNNFLNQHEQKFKNEESIQALKSIKDYLTQKRKELKEQDIKTRELRREVLSTCNHEIIIKNGNNCYSSYECLICKKNILENYISNKDILIIDITKDYQLIYQINEIFKEVINTDKDLIETIINEVEKIQYEKELKIYRRSK